jgi:membrane protease YdiL (CAAX protease family)
METQTDDKSTPHFKLIVFIGITLVFAFALGMQMFVTSLSLDYYNKLFYSRFIYWADVALLFMYAYALEHQHIFIWPRQMRGFRKVAIAVVLLYLLFIVASLISAVPAMLGWKEASQTLLQMTSLMRTHPIFLVFTALTAGVTEELIFRAYLLTRLSILIKNKWLSVIISSLMFALLHYRYHSLREYIFAFLIGVIFSVHYQKYGNIKPLIITHFLIDLLSLEFMVHLTK